MVDQTPGLPRKAVIPWKPIEHPWKSAHPERYTIIKYNHLVWERVKQHSKTPLTINQLNPLPTMIVLTPPILPRFGDSRRVVHPFGEFHPVRVLRSEPSHQISQYRKHQ